MPLAFDFASAYAIAFYVAGAIVVWAAFLGYLGKALRWFRARIRPPAPPPLPNPAVVLGAAGGRQTLVHADGEPHRRLATVEPRYLIENKGPTVVREIDTGVESFDRVRTHQFEAFHAPALAPFSEACVENVGSIPSEMLRDVHESAAFNGHLYWASLEDADGTRWRAIYDPRDRSHSYELLERAAAPA